MCMSIAHEFAAGYLCLPPAKEWIALLQLDSSAGHLCLPLAEERIATLRLELAAGHLCLLCAEERIAMQRQNTCRYVPQVCLVNTRRGSHRCCGAARCLCLKVLSAADTALLCGVLPLSLIGS